MLLPGKHQWLTPVILATQKEEIRRIEVQSQPGKQFFETLPQKKNPSHTQKRAGGIAQDVDPEFKPQYCKKILKVIYLLIYLALKSVQSSSQ
jgi:hypothetical protein